MAESTPPTGRERRVWVRHPGTPGSPYYCVSEQEDIISWKARVNDISRGGISLVLRSTFAPDALIDIVFPANSEGDVRKLNARVVRSEPQDDMTWLVGCAFVKMLSEDELRALLEAAGE